MTRRQLIWLLAVVVLVGVATARLVMGYPHNKWWSSLPYRANDYGPNETE